jgi:hypothetical protein
MGLFLSSSLIPHPSSLSWAAHPFITDDADTQGRGNWQLELQAERSRHDATGDVGAGPTRQRSRSILFNPVLTYGVLDDVEVALGLNYLRYHVSQNGGVAGEASGLADSSLEVKWQFYEEDGFSMALKPGLSLPTGDEKRGLGAGRTSWGVNFIAAYEAKPWSWLGNIEYVRPRFKLSEDAAENRRNLWRVSGGTAYAVRGDTKLVGELGIRTNEARDDPFLPGRTARFAMLGAIYSPTDKVDFDIGIRKGLNRAETDITLLVGATLRW